MVDSSLIVTVVKLVISGFRAAVEVRSGYQIKRKVRKKLRKIKWQLSDLAEIRRRKKGQRPVQAAGMYSRM